MSENALVHPLLWDGYALADAIREHWLAPVYPEIVTLVDELGQCLAAGIAVWRDSYWDEARAYRDSPDSLADMSDAEFDRCTLAGYPEGIQSAARAIFCGLRSAEQHGGFKSFAAAIRWHCSVDEDIPDRHLYALAAAIEAWWAMDSLVIWLNEGMAELARTFSSLRDIEDADLLAWMDADPDRWAAFEHRNQQFTVEEWARHCPAQFLRWVVPYREQWALSEAGAREQAARYLGEAERLLILAGIAGELAQAAHEIEQAAWERKEAALARAQAALDSLSMKPYKEKVERQIEAGRQGGKQEPWGWAKPHWRKFAGEWWQRHPGHSVSRVRDEIIKRHNPTHPDTWKPSATDISAGAKEGQPGKTVVSDAIKDLQPPEYRTNAGRPSKQSADASGN